MEEVEVAEVKGRWWRRWFRWWGGGGREVCGSISASFFPIEPLRLRHRVGILSRPSPIVRSIIRTRFSAHTHPSAPPTRPPCLPAPLLSPRTSSKSFFWEHLFPRRRLPHCLAAQETTERRSKREESVINHTPVIRVQSSARIKNSTWELLQRSDMT